MKSNPEIPYRIPKCPKCGPSIRTPNETRDTKINKKKDLIVASEKASSGGRGAKGVDQPYMPFAGSPGLSKLKIFNSKAGAELGQVIPKREKRSFRP